MQIDPEVFSAIERIEWMTSCGKESSLSTEKCLRQVSSWAEADKAFDEIWESIVDDQQSAITSTLFERYRDKVKYWNDLIVEATQHIDEDAGPTVDRVVEELQWHPFYAKSIRRHLVLYVMELTYAQYKCVVPIFFRNLFTIYGAGHFPCGWGGGTFPNGYLLYY